LRNVLIAAGNSGDESLVPQVEHRLSDASPLVRAMAVWALSRLAPDWAAAVRESEAQTEADPTVAEEWARIGV
jgi:epoxyqueuosine reductase